MFHPDDPRRNQPPPEKPWQLEILAAANKQTLERMEAPPEPPDVYACGWREDDDGNWQTSCGEVYVFIEGNPTENDYRCCPGCGKPITIIQPKG